MAHKSNGAYTGGKEKSKGSTRRVRCIDTSTEYHSVVEASEMTGIPKAHIYANALGARVNAGGMQWEYLDAPHRVGPMSELYRENKSGIKNGRAKPIRCIETGEIFETCQALAQKLGIRKSIISRFMNGNHRHLGLHYEYIDKGEITNGISFSESKKNSDED